MRELSVSDITLAVKEMCIEANQKLPVDLEKQINVCASTETCGMAKDILRAMQDNLNAAKELNIPICQDTGMAVIFADIGQDVHMTGGDFEEAANEGVRQGYREGYLRCSVLADPLRRVNTGDNTPAIIHTRIVPGEAITLTVAPKGFGSENMSAIRMFTPADTRQDIIEFVKETVRNAGGNPCPPIVLGVGIGGDFEYAALLAKKALCRSVSQRNRDSFYAELEEEMLAEINSLGIGPQGFGGDTTALAVNIEIYPTHIAGLPVAVNMGCHVTRHVRREL